MRRVAISPSEVTGWILRRIQAGIDDACLDLNWAELSVTLAEWGVPAERRIDIARALQERRVALTHSSAMLHLESDGVQAVPA
jgi:hypothetical protein